MQNLISRIATASVLRHGGAGAGAGKHILGLRSAATFTKTKPSAVPAGVQPEEFDAAVVTQRVLAEAERAPVKFAYNRKRNAAIVLRITPEPVTTKRPTKRQRRFMATAASNTVVIYSDGSDEAVLWPRVERLLASAGKGGRWEMMAGGKGLERSFKFKNFAKTWVSLLYSYLSSRL
jgi:hypothetical protein